MSGTHVLGLFAQDDCLWACEGQLMGVLLTDLGDPSVQNLAALSCTGRQHLCQTQVRDAAEGLCWCLVTACRRRRLDPRGADPFSALQCKWHVRRQITWSQLIMDRRD